MNEGDVDSEDWNASTFEFKFKARLFGFLNFLGDGDVIGRSSLIANREGLVSIIFKL